MLPRKFGKVVATQARIDIFNDLLRFSLRQIVKHSFFIPNMRAKFTVTGKESGSCGGEFGCRFNLGAHFVDPSLPLGTCDRLTNSPTDKSFRSVYRQAEKGFYVFREYSSIWSDQDIGNFASKDLNEVYIVLIAHELAHHINYNVSSVHKWYGQNHDAGWQRTYRAVRAMLLQEYREMNH